MTLNNQNIMSHSKPYQFDSKDRFAGALELSKVNKINDYVHN